MSDFELIILGFFMGCAFSFVMIGSGVWFSELTKKGKRDGGTDEEILRNERH